MVTMTLMEIYNMEEMVLTIAKVYKLFNKYLIRDQVQEI